MAHQSLYRKYRPNIFDDMVGQQHIERTLRNAVASDSVAHAYLFTGPRGTGKTTSARLLAKALMCEQGPTDNPDGTCEACHEINDGVHPDVIELDAASRNGVEAVRTEIIERVYFAPQRGAYKVYIIDEVHMLSNAAFNAMLKTLEEPPSHVIFILCTTDPQKVPATIQSRCQRFDFHPISAEEIASRLRFIAQSEEIKIENAALALIAKHAEGGMRDAITTLEQLAAFTGNDIKVDDVEGVLGEVSAEALADLMRSIARRDTASGFLWVANQVEMGADLPELVRGIIAFVRDMYVLAILGDVDSEMLLTATAEDRQTMHTLVAEFEGPERIARIISLLSEVSGAMRYSTEPRTLLEVALVRMTRVESELTLEALSERIERLEVGGVSAPMAPRDTSATRNQSHTTHSHVAKDEAPQKAVAPQNGPTSAPVVPAGALTAGVVKRSWRSVLAEIKKVKTSRYLFFADTEVEMGGDESIVVLWPQDAKFKMENAKNNTDFLKNALQKVFGKEVPFIFAMMGEQNIGASPKPASPARPAPVQQPTSPQVDETAVLDAVPEPSKQPAVAEISDDVDAPAFEQVPDKVRLGGVSDEASASGDDLFAKLSALGTIIEESKGSADQMSIENEESAGTQSEPDEFVQPMLTQDYLTDPDED